MANPFLITTKQLRVALLYAYSSGACDGAAGAYKGIERARSEDCGGEAIGHDEAALITALGPAVVDDIMAEMGVK